MPGRRCHHAPRHAHCDPKSVGVWFEQRSGRKLAGYGESDRAGSIEGTKSPFRYLFVLDSGPFSWGTDRQGATAQRPNAMPTSAASCVPPPPLPSECRHHCAFGLPPYVTGCNKDGKGVAPIHLVARGGAKVCHLILPIAWASVCHAVPTACLAVRTRAHFAATPRLFHATKHLKKSHGSFESISNQKNQPPAHFLFFPNFSYFSP